MKKIIISSLALAAATVASANQNALVAASLDNGSEVKLERSGVLKVMPAKDVKMATSAILKSDLKASENASRAEETPDINPLYNYPNGTFFSFFTFDAGNEPYTLPNVAFAPAYCDNVWTNDSWYTIAPGNPTWRLPEGTSYQWQILGGNGTVIDEATTFDFTSYMEAATFKGQGYYAPVLTINGKEYQYGQEGSQKFNPQFFEYGGRGAGDPEMMAEYPGYLASQLGVQVTNFQDGGAQPYNRASDDFFGNFTGGAFNYPGSAEESVEVYYADEQNGITADMIKVLGFCQMFPAPAAPYALSDLSVTARITCKANAKLNFTFAPVVNDKIDLENPILEYTHTFVEDVNDKTIAIEIPFTSLNEIGDELDYMLVDTEMIMIISGFAGNELITSFNPLIAGFLYDTTYSYFSPDPSYTMAMLQIGTGENAQIGFSSTRYLAGFRGQTGVEYVSYNSMVIEMNVEYPYIKPMLNIVTGEEYDPTTEIISVGLSNDEYETAVAVLCPGDVENVTCSTITGDDIPSWLVCEVVSAAEFEADDNGPVDEGQKYFYVYLGLADNAPATPVNCYVKLEYKGQSTVMFVTTGDPAGIDNVTAAEAAELDWNAPVYNVMGQKVSQGYTGIAIQNGKKFIVE